MSPNPSSQNALKHGLFATRDFILDTEREEYSKTLTNLLIELRPQGALEDLYLSEIMSATWKLRRCRVVEMESQDEADQRSIHRARAQSHNILRRSLAELRKLQTERALRVENGKDHLPPLADSAQISRLTHKNSAPDPEPDPGFDLLQQLAMADRNLGMKTPSASSFCNPSAATPRNALCPCGSGAKFKRCCGKDAPPVLNMAA